jgi:putative transposase
MTVEFPYRAFGWVVNVFTLQTSSFRMPRRRRFCPAGFPIHVIQRGINRQICFASDADIAAYAHWLAEGAQKFEVCVHGWVFMTNHVHLLLTPHHDSAVSGLMQFLGRLYVRHFNYCHARSGGLFEDRFKSSVVQDDIYLLNCLRYIELNPVRAGMVADPGDYRWSSYAAHGYGNTISMLTPHRLYVSLGETKSARSKNYRRLIGESLGADVIAKIRHCANKGLVLGTEKFEQQFEEITGSSPSAG